MRSTRVTPHRSEQARLANRLFSLSGVVPLGAFLVVHVIANARALRGDAAFLAATRAFERVPALPIVEALFVFAPLLFHGAVGAWLVATRRQREPAVPYPSAVRTAMRVTGVVAIAFLAMHLPELRFRHPGVRPGGGEVLTVLVSDLSSTWYGVPWRGVVYLTASGCVAFHFAAGLWGYFVTARGHDDPRAGDGGEGGEGREGRERRERRETPRWAAWIAIGVGVVLWALLADVVVLHATGARVVGSPPEGAGPRFELSEPAEPCPAPAAEPH
jgi:succinate dehydrogenase / fumarate reductase cytochrome b subunit